MKENKNIIQELFEEKNKILEKKQKNINCWNTFKEIYNEGYIDGINKALEIIKKGED